LDHPTTAAGDNWPRPSHRHYLEARANLHNGAYDYHDDYAIRELRASNIRLGKFNNKKEI